MLLGIYMYVSSVRLFCFLLLGAEAVLYPTLEQDVGYIFEPRI